MNVELRVLAILVLASATAFAQAGGQRGGARGGAPAAPAASSAQAPIPANLQNLTGDPGRGKDLYVKYSCYSCHLYSGNGYQGAPGGASLVGLPMNMPAFIMYIRNPPNPTRMPPFTTKVMTDQQAADVWAYIKTLASSPAAKDIPLLQQMLGEK